MKYKAILRPPFKRRLFAPLHTISVGSDFFHVPESTSSDLNAVANNAVVLTALKVFQSICKQRNNGR